MRQKDDGGGLEENRPSAEGPNQIKKTALQLPQIEGR